MLDEFLLMLTREQKLRLAWSLKNGLADFVLLPDGHLLGVNLRELWHVEVIEEDGGMMLGRKTCA